MENTDPEAGDGEKAEEIRGAEEKTEEKMKTVREGEIAFTSSAETVASTPAERIENVSHTTTTLLKKAENSLWIKGISPNTKAADLKAYFFKKLFLMKNMF